MAGVGDEAVGAVGMTNRDQNLIRYCEPNGTLPLFEKALLASGEVSAGDVRQRFISFVCDMRYMERNEVPAWIYNKYKMVFDGGNVRFYRGQEIIMVLYRRKPRYFFPAKYLTARPVPKVQESVFKTSCGVMIPQGGKIFDAALKSQLPSRGRPTPDGQIRRP